jgi:phosphopantothenoylcysteine synthetase/decarboxylase
VGRILRQKHSSPLVIDIIDGHDIFMSQWYKRRKYYKSQDYKILVCDNTEYDMQGFKTDLSKWKVSWAPKGEGASVGVSKKTQGGKTKVAAPITAPVKGNTKVKTIAEKLNIKINVKGKHNRNHEDADAGEDEVQIETDDDNDNNEEVDERTYSDSDSDSDDEKKRKTTRGKSGLAGKGCLIDITKL